LICVPGVGTDAESGSAHATFAKPVAVITVAANNTGHRHQALVTHISSVYVALHINSAHVPIAWREEARPRLANVGSRCRQRPGIGTKSLRG
jgi:hypothetical protein